jgi:hypothetical protein
MASYLESDFVLDCLGIGEVQDTLQEGFLLFMGSEDFNYSPKKISITTLDDTLNSTLKTPKLRLKNGIQFSSSEIVSKVFETLKPFFKDNLKDLQAVLHGEEIEHSILFRSRQNQLSEFFKRVQYNDYIISSKSDLSDWICKNFSFIDSKENVVKPFNRTTVWGVISKNRSIPSKTSKIGVDWFPYKSNN